MYDDDHDDDHDDDLHHAEEAHDDAYDATHSSGSSSWCSASDAESHLHQMESPTAMQIHEVNQAKEHAYKEWHKSVNGK